MCGWITSRPLVETILVNSFGRRSLLIDEPAGSAGDATRIWCLERRRGRLSWRAGRCYGRESGVGMTKIWSG
jgi:hypothetical protein